MLGVFVALAIGDTIRLNGLTVGLLVAGSLAIAELLLRMPLWAATQMPVSVLVVLGAVAVTEHSSGWWHAIDTLIGAAVGVAVSLAFPASRLIDGRQTLNRLAEGIGDSLDAMGHGLEEPWSSDQTAGGDAIRASPGERLVSQAAEAVGDSRDPRAGTIAIDGTSTSSRALEDLMPRVERSAIGVSAIARTLDEFAQRSTDAHAPMRR